MSQQIRESYIIEILQILKNLALHQLFMQRIREQLSDNEKFDPLTAFKLMDSFKHNMVIGVELKGFLQLQGYDVSNKQCQQAIKSLNKAQDSLNYHRFLQIIMPYNLKKKNLSLTRYNTLQVTIGTYDLITSVKKVTRQLLAKFFIKEIQFIRTFNSQRQHFCLKWGADIHTISQIMFKPKKQKLNNVSLKNPLFNYQTMNDTKQQQTPLSKDTEKQIGFENFYEFSRYYKCYFNKEEFKSIWRRVKTVEERIILKPQQIFIKQQDLMNLLLVKDFNTKVKYANKYEIPLKSLSIPPPSYKLPIGDEMVHDSVKYRKQQQQEYFDRRSEEIKKEAKDPLSYRMKTFCSYPELQLNTVSPMLKQKQQQWKDLSGKMSNYMIDERYQQIIQRQKAPFLYHRR